MQIKNTLVKIQELINKEAIRGKKVTIYMQKSLYLKELKTYNIKVELHAYKHIILQDETKLELGGINKKSFSLIYPTSDPSSLSLIHDGRITLIGPEIAEIKGSSVDFGLFIIITGSSFSQKQVHSLKQFSFLSNGIEGFLIRTIPRRFWCRISHKSIQNNFSFKFLGNAIFYLYRQQFKELIDSMEILFINSYTDSIREFIKITSDLFNQENEEWLKKIENWEKRIDCEYDWGCEICPYQEECYKIKQVLVEREKIEK